MFAIFKKFEAMVEKQSKKSIEKDQTNGGADIHLMNLSLVVKNITLKRDHNYNTMAC